MDIIKPHGGKLINRFEKNERQIKIYLEKIESNKIKKIVIDDRFASLCEMIGNGGFSPLEGFMTKEDAESVIRNMRLKNGLLWSIPVLLPIVNKEMYEDIKLGKEIALFDKNDRLIAILLVEDKFKLDLDEYCENVFKTKDENHPGVAVVKKYGNHFIGGPIKVFNRPLRGEIDEKYYKDPLEVRQLIINKGWRNVVAFQTRNPIHRAHESLIKYALENMDGVLIHPLVGETKKDDIPAEVRMKCYQILIDNYFNKERVLLSVMPAPMNYAGPREAIHHMIIRKNYGCNYMIIGRDHAGVGNYYGTYEAQKLVAKYEEELGIKALKFEHAFYCKKCEQITTSKTCPHSADYRIHLSGTKVREMLRKGIKPPKEFSRPEVVEILMKWAQSFKK